MTPIKHPLFLLIGFLLAAAAAGFSLLKAYEEFQRSIETKNKKRIWASFFIVSFLFITLTYAIVRAAIQ